MPTHHHQRAQQPVHMLGGQVDADDADDDARVDAYCADCGIGTHSDWVDIFYGVSETTHPFGDDADCHRDRWCCARCAQGSIAALHNFMSYSVVHTR